jgi:hypothetical protein
VGKSRKSKTKSTLFKSPDSIKSNVPSISIALLEERRRKEETKKLLFDTLVQDQAEQMHSQLLQSVEEINELSIFLGFSVQYSIKEEDRNLVRSMRDTGQMFIQRRKLFTNKDLKRKNKKNWNNEDDCRMYTMSGFLKELEKLKIDASKVRSIHPTADSKERISYKPVKNIDIKDEKNIIDVKKYKDQHDGKTNRVKMTEDSLNGAQSSGNRLLTSLLNKNNLYGSITENTQEYEELYEPPENHDLGMFIKYLY